MAEIKEVKGATLPDGTEVRFKDEQARETIKDLQVSAGSLTLGETSGTAYRGDRGKIAYDHSQAAHAPTDAEKNVQSDWTETDTSSDAYIKNKPTEFPPSSHKHTWDDVTNKPSTFPPSEHDHDDVYATPEYVDEAVKNTSTPSITPSMVVDLIYPVGSIYMSVNSANPSTFIGGTWIPWGSGRVPVGVDEDSDYFAYAEQIGGEATHTLTTEEMPDHNHGVWGRSVYSGTGSYIALCNKANSSTSYVTSDKGGGKAHNNLQPYIACYMWKRTS